MSLGDVLRALIEAPHPTVASLRAYFAPQATGVTTAGPNLASPAWADAVHGEHDVFVALSGALAGAQLWEDARGWGTYVDLAVTTGTLADVEAVAGALASVPKNPGASDALDTVGTTVAPAGRRVRVFAKHDRGAVKRVLLHFEA